LTVTVKRVAELAAGGFRGIEDFGRVAVDRGCDPALLVSTYTPHRGAAE